MKSGRPHALFRCDASATIGAGHVTRCLALAEALSGAGWCISFAIRPGTTATVSEIERGGYSLHEMPDKATEEPAALRASCPDGVDLLVVDHYERDIHFEQACRGFACQILVMDDATGRRHDCDFLVDAAVTDRSVYADAIPAQARLLLGPAFALVRRSFVERRAEALLRRDGRPVENILVSFGATDPRNVTSVALSALESTAEECAITVALSSQAPHLDEIRAKLHGQMQLILDGDMSELMTLADLGIGAAGASSYERAVLGLPSIAVVAADNQRNLALLIGSVGAALLLDGISSEFCLRLERGIRALVEDSHKRNRMTRDAARLVDGNGPNRMAKLLRKPVRVNFP